jgi:anti-sigma B factor antagonist
MGLRTVRLVGLPVEVHRQASEHSDTIIRELTLIAGADDVDAVPARLRELSERLTERYASFTSAQTQLLQAAQTNGATTIDLVYELPPEVADDCEVLAGMLDEVDAYCRDGALVSLVTPPEAAAYRRWFLNEVIHQIRDGGEPLPWPGFEAQPDGEPHGQDEDGAPGTPDATEEVVIDVEGALDLDGASRLRPVVAEHLDAGEVTLVFDLRHCDFVDSVGLSLLLTTRNRCVENAGSLRVTNLQPFVQTTFRHAGVLDLLTPTD